MTNTIDTSFMNSYFNKDMSKEDLIINFGINRDSIIQIHTDNIEEYKTFVKHLAKLTWVIKNNYKNASNDNKQLIGELIELFLIYYFNCFSNKYKCINDLSNTSQSQDEHTINSISSESEEIRDALSAIASFIIKVHYKNKYIDIKNLPTNELLSYIAMEENIKPSNYDLEENYQQAYNNVQPIETINYDANQDDIFQITRRDIHIILDQLQHNDVHNIWTFMSDLLKKPLTQTEEDLPAEPYIDEQLEDLPSDTYIDEPLEEIIDVNDIYQTVTKIMNVDDKPINITEEELIKEMGNDIEFESISDSEIAQLMHNDMKKIYKNIKKTKEETDASMTDIVKNDSVEMSIDDSRVKLINESDIIPVIDLNDPEPFDNEEPYALEEQLGINLLSGKYFTSEDIIKYYYHDAWDNDVDYWTKKIAYYISNDIISITDVELKKVSIYELKYIIYILSFLKSEKFL